MTRPSWKTQTERKSSWTCRKAACIAGKKNIKSTKQITFHQQLVACLKDCVRTHDEIGERVIWQMWEILELCVYDIHIHHMLHRARFRNSGQNHLDILTSCLSLRAMTFFLPMGIRLICIVTEKALLNVEQGYMPIEHYFRALLTSTCRMSQYVCRLRVHGLLFR